MLLRYTSFKVKTTLQNSDIQYLFEANIHCPSLLFIHSSLVEQEKRERAEHYYGKKKSLPSVSVLIRRLCWSYWTVAGSTCSHCNSSLLVVDRNCKEDLHRESEGQQHQSQYRVQLPAPSSEGW